MESRTRVVSVKVITRASRNEVRECQNGLIVHLTAPPVEGKANELLVELLAEYFHCTRSQVKIIRGEKSRNKLIRILPAT